MKSNVHDFARTCGSVSTILTAKNTATAYQTRTSCPSAHLAPPSHRTIVSGPILPPFVRIFRPCNLQYGRDIRKVAISHYPDICAFGLLVRSSLTPTDRSSTLAVPQSLNHQLPTTDDAHTALAVSAALAYNHPVQSQGNRVALPAVAVVVGAAAAAAVAGD